MGLSIYYQLQTPLTRASEVRVLVETLRQTAQRLPFEQVSRVVEFEGKDADFANSDRTDPFLWLKIQAGQYLHVETQDVEVKPLHIVAFCAWPGSGCEPANFGYCQFPSSVEAPADLRGPRRLPTGLDGWRWQSYCKTQYASDPSHGDLENFFRCHLSVIHLLDFAKATELTSVEVTDDGGYWDHRALDQLGQAVGTWNELVAAVAGMAKDVAATDGTKLRSAIAAFPNFEHLEAKGLDRLKLLRERHS